MEDYERKNAEAWDIIGRGQRGAAATSDQQEKPEEEWTVVTGEDNKGKNESVPQQPQQVQNHRDAQSGQVTKKQPARPPPRLTQVDDNSAELSWRNHEPPAAHILIPSLILSYGAHGREHLHENIARQHDAFIFCQDEGPNNHLNFGIWGNDTAVKNATRALNQWIQKAEGQNKSKKSFARMTSLTPAAKEKALKEWKRHMNRQRFRQNPPPSSKFGTIGSFHWPADEYRPEDSLGMSYEALDPIRMEFSCYVTFVKADSVFRVYGNNEKVHGALARLKGTLCQIAARQVNPLRVYLLYWTDASSLPTHVRLLPYQRTKDISSKNPQHEFGHIPRAEGTDLLDLSMKERNVTSELELQRAILATLRKLHYYRGCIQMRIRLGTFLATQYRRCKDGGMYRLEDYEDMIQEDQFEGRVTHELGERAVEASALTALQQADALLLPADNTCEHLHDVRPEYSVTFTFSDPAGDICLTMIWRRMSEIYENAAPSFEMCSKTWTRLDRDSKTPVSILDANFSDLHSGLAWAFEISATQPIEESRLSEAYQLFGDSITLNIDVAVADTAEKLFVVFRPPSGSVQLKHIQQRSVYRYNMLSSTSGATDYVLELIRFQDIDTSPQTLMIPQPPPSRTKSSLARPQSQSQSQQQFQQNQVFYEPRWGLQVYRNGWDVDFAQNATLKVGNMADWCHRGRTWFPADEGLEDEVDNGQGAEDERTPEEESREECRKRIEEREQEKMQVGKGFAQLIQKLERVKKIVFG